MDYIVEKSERYKRREILSRFDGDLAREIAELVTNAIDSYGRIQNFNGEKIVKIEVAKGSKKGEKFVIRVIDNAEGMSMQQLVEIFRLYASDNNGGGTNDKIRGLFGQGASDCMSLSAYEKKSAEYISFKDGEVSRLRFYLDESSNIRFNPKCFNKSQEIKSLRESYGIENNGTVVTFGIPDGAKFKYDIEGLKHSIETMYLLRNILMDDRNKVYLKSQDGSILLSAKQYALPDKSFKEENISFSYKGKEFNGTISFYKNDNKEDNLIDILVEDNRGNLYDNQMFGFRRSPGNNFLSGRVIIDQFYENASYFLNEESETIINDDRSGFNITKGFGKRLSEALANSIDEALHILLKEKEVKNISLTKNKKDFDFLSFLNKDLKNVQPYSVGGGSEKGKQPPASGIAFARNNISITSGHNYDLKLYLNKEIISVGDIITIDTIGNDGFISYTNNIIIGKKDLEEEIPSKSCVILGIKKTDIPIELYASCGACKARCNVNVIEDEIIYPENGLQFEKSDVTLTPDTNHKVKLYYDKTKFSDYDKIILTDNADNKLKFKQQTFNINDGIKINDDVGYFNIEFSGGDLKDSYIIVATCKEYNDKLNIKIDASPSQGFGKSGDISDWSLNPAEYEKLPQSTFDPMHGIIYIYTKNAINNIFVKEWKPDLSGNPKLFVISLVCYEAARLYASKKAQQGHLPENSYEDYINLVEEKKNEYYNEYVMSLKKSGT